MKAKIYIFLFLFLIKLYEMQCFAAPLPVLVVYSLGGKNDHSFNESLSRGIEKARKNLPLEITEKEPIHALHMAQAFENIEAFPLVISLGFENIENFEKCARLYPQKSFVFMDYNVDISNVLSTTFKEEEGAFLAGYMAGKMTKTNKIGFIGGVNQPPVQRFLTGYEHGVKEANGQNEVFHTFIGNSPVAWLSSRKAKILARRYYSSDVDIIFGVAGESNSGIFEAAQESQKYAIGVDVNQNKIAPGSIITSVEKKLDNVIYKILEDYSNAKFKPGHVILGIKENAIDLSIDENTRRIVSKEIIESVENIKNKMAINK